MNGIARRDLTELLHQFDILKITMTKKTDNTTRKNYVRHTRSLIQKVFYECNAATSTIKSKNHLNLNCD